MADQTYNSDTVKNGNPYKKKSHSYDVVELMHATTFERTVDDLGQTQWIFSDGGKTSLHPRIHQKYDYNMALKLPDEIRNAAPQHRQECAIDLFYEWKRPIGKQTQDTLKVTDLQIHKDYQPGPIAQRLLDERAERHPELFDSAGNPSQEEPFHTEPLTNPNPPSNEQRAEMLREAQESMARIAEDAKTPDTSAIATTSIAPQADSKPLDNTKETPAVIDGLDLFDEFLRTEETIIATGDYSQGDDEQDELDAARPADIVILPPDSELDEVFGKREKRPIINPGNWTHDGPKLRKFYADLNDKGWNKYGIPGPEKSKHIHAALGVNSLHETNLSPDVALVAVLVYLDKLFGKKDDNVTAPETTEITKDQWQAWLNDHNWNKKPFVLIALNAYSIEHGEGPVTKLGEWGFELDIATDAVNAFLDDVASREEKAPPQGESEAQGPTEPPKQEAPAQPPVVSDEPAIEAPMLTESSRALAVYDQPSSVVQAGLFPVQSEWQTMKELAQTAFKSGLLPKGIKSVEAALYIIETGRELGISPTLAIRKIQIIQGQPTLAAELMLALVKRSGQLEFIKIDGDETKCTVTMRRKGESDYVEVFTMDMARKMQTSEWDDQSKSNKRISLAEKFNWRTMPAVMLKWRAVSAACRTVFPDITLGIYTSEEMSDSIALNDAA